MIGCLKRIPVAIIIAATNGDAYALAYVLAHYQKFIQTLATRILRDEYGNEYFFLDEAAQLRLEAKLIHSIINGFQVLSV